MNSGLPSYFTAENITDAFSKYGGNPDRHFDRRRMLVVLDRVYRLTAHANLLSQSHLRYFAILESEFPGTVRQGHYGSGFLMDSRQRAISCQRSWADPVSSDADIGSASIDQVKQRRHRVSQA